MQILVLNGPNLNLLGQREPGVYGTQSLGEIESLLRRNAARHVRLDFFQSNHEGALIDQLQQASRKYQGVVFNPGGYAHASVAIRDAISAISIPVVEVHLSNIHGREEFRAHSITAGACAGIISGLGVLGYQAAIEALERLVGRSEARGEVRGEARREERRPEERRPEDRRDDKADKAGKADKADKLPEDKTEDRDEESGDDTDRGPDGRRRRRGRRGGRGRSRRGGEGPAGPGDESRDQDGAESHEHVPIDIEAKYANLQGATVRRGLDVLAESGDDDDDNKPRGKVTFTSVSADEVPPEDLVVVRQEPRSAKDDSPDAPIRRVRVTGSRRQEQAPAAPLAHAPAPQSAPDRARPATEDPKASSRAAKLADKPAHEAPRSKAAVPAEGDKTEVKPSEDSSENKRPARGRRKTSARGDAGRKAAPRKRAAKKPASGQGGEGAAE